MHRHGVAVPAGAKDEEQTVALMHALPSFWLVEWSIRCLQGQFFLMDALLSIPMNIANLTKRLTTNDRQ